MNKNLLFQEFLSKNFDENNCSTLINEIREITFQLNRDNISRTSAYLYYYLRNPEIKWAFLASMVSRNAGYNMCDLASPAFQTIIPKAKREMFYLAYEHANWLIFHDAFPQLMIYYYSKKIGKPLFSLLPQFTVSQFMAKEWEWFWNRKDEKRLLQALIINEQNVIQNPILKHRKYKKRVFRSLLFYIQDQFHFSFIVFPTLNGDLFGSSVKNFKRVHSRIVLGNLLSEILFHPNLYADFLRFAKKVEHTGSRWDYEKYLRKSFSSETPVWKTIYAIVDHSIEKRGDWFDETKIIDKWFHPSTMNKPILLTDWIYKKHLQIQSFAKWKRLFS
ncbi:hypothetical protein J2S13_000050 [Oikeobacillus pervagus]|uniref:DUF2515 domain-containing protein n=1 Tax=Oikeobacillus pervagus TaxID=1325931 RepID=A0AAJ1SYF7_9BACI|nr:DUF2515 family protein [Oikeobacillus pervagus]MDQ0213656.1 hypothetical protein [Oikeobacillus pervagus]